MDVVRKITSCSLAITVVLSMLFVSCKKSRDIPTSENVILILVDALRADHLGSYGYHRDTTPHIDSLAQTALFCVNSFSQSSYTPTSMASLFTGTYPFVHKVFIPPKVDKEYSVLPLSLVTIPEAFQEFGFHTTAITSTGWISQNSNYDQGFDEFHLVKRKDRIIINNAVKFIKRKRETNFFLYLHLLDLHDYFWLNGKNRKFLKSSYNLSKKMNELHSEKPSDIYKYLINYGNEETLSEDDLEYLIDRYDSSLYYTDQLIGELVQALKDEQILEKTLIVITADHGEKFLEHGELVHGGKTLYNEVVHVPLIIHNKKAFPLQKRVERLVEAVDVFATLIDFCNLDEVKLGETNQLQGSSILEDVKNKTIFIVSSRRNKMKILNGKWSLIYSTDANETELYDLHEDPDEKIDISDQHKDITEEMLKMLRSKITESMNLSQSVKHEYKKIDNEVRETLKSLGYIK
jgi:arylsulfatase